MRVAAILGPGCSPKTFKPFQQAAPDSEWSGSVPDAGDHCDAIILCGGDGTIHRHLEALVNLDLPVLIIPAGSGNDFARALGLPNLRTSLAAWQHFCKDKSNVRQVDLGVVSGIAPEADPAPPPQPARSSRLAAPRYFATVAGIGLSSEVTRRANALPRWLRARGGYALGLAATVFRFAPLAMKILASGRENGWRIRSDRPTLLAAFANTSTYGDGMKIAPHARINDGELDVCIIGGIDPLKLFCMFPTVYSGRHLEIEGVDSFRAERLRIETESPLEVYADGEFVCRTPVEIGLQRAALKIISP